MSTSFNDTLRQAAGRTPRPAADQVLPAGNIGIGQGGAARPAPQARLDSMEVSVRIRRGARLARQLTAPGGVALNLDDSDPFA